MISNGCNAGGGVNNGRGGAGFVKIVAEGGDSGKHDRGDVRLLVDEW